MANYTVTGTDNLTLQAVKKQVNVTFDDDDVELTNLISVSLIAVENYCREVFLERSYTQIIGKFSTGVLPPVLTTDTTSKPKGFVEIVYFVGGVETTIEISPLTQYTKDINHYYYINNYIVITVKDSVSVDVGVNVTLKWVTGMDTIDTVINHARLLLCGTYYENRESAIIGTISSGLPDGTKYLLEPYMNPQVG